MIILWLIYILVFSHFTEENAIIMETSWEVVQFTEHFRPLRSKCSKITQPYSRLIVGNSFYCTVARMIVVVVQKKVESYQSFPQILSPFLSHSSSEKCTKYNLILMYSSQEFYFSSRFFPLTFPINPSLHFWRLD